MIYKRNMGILKDYYPEIYDKMNVYKPESIWGYSVLLSKTGYPTIWVKDNGKKTLIHSLYDPVRESDIFIANNIEPEYTTYLVYGAGFFYHIAKLAEKAKNAEIYIFEANKLIFFEALKNIDISDIFTNNKIHFFLIEKIEDFCENFAIAFNQKIQVKFLQHLPSLYAIPQEFSLIGDLMEEYRIKEHAYRRDHKLMERNFYSNILKCEKNVDELFGKFLGAPAIIVSAGPSLDKNKSLLKMVKRKALVICVGRALKSVLDENVLPDLVVMTDPNDILYEQINGLDIDVPLVLLSTANYLVALKYKGQKYLALQEGYDLSERFAKENGNELVRSGGSVATVALDITIKLGCNPIILIGQDLACTNGKMHTADTFEISEYTDQTSLVPYEDINGNITHTTKIFNIYRRWIEKTIEEENDITFINATEGGVKIKGTIVMKFEEAIDKYIETNHTEIYFPGKQ